MKYKKYRAAKVIFREAFDPVLSHSQWIGTIDFAIPCDGEPSCIRNMNIKRCVIADWKRTFRDEGRIWGCGEEP